MSSSARLDATPFPIQMTLFIPFRNEENAIFTAETVAQPNCPIFAKQALNIPGSQHITHYLRMPPGLSHEPYREPKAHILQKTPAGETSWRSLYLPINTATPPPSFPLSSPWNLHHCCRGALRL